jgi:hypothetical protein
MWRKEAPLTVVAMISLADTTGCQAPAAVEALLTTQTKPGR